MSSLYAVVHICQCNMYLLKIGFSRITFSYLSWSLVKKAYRPNPNLTCYNFGAWAIGAQNDGEKDGSFWATVCKRVRPMLPDRCLSVLYVLSVTPVYCDQTVWRIKMKLGTQVGLGPGHIVLDGNPVPLLQRGRSPWIFGPYLLRPNGCRDQDATWYGCRTQPMRLCVRWGPRSPLPKRGGRSPSRKFSAHVYCGQTAGWIKMPLGTKVGLSPGDSVLGTQLPPPPTTGAQQTSSFRPMSIVATVAHLSYCWALVHYSMMPLHHYNMT